MQDLMHFKKCGECGADIPITQIAIGEDPCIIDWIGGRRPITHWWCLNCGAITVMRPCILNAVHLDLIQYHVNESKDRKEFIKEQEKIWKEKGVDFNDR